MIEFKRDTETGEVVAYEDGREVGSVSTMGDVIEDRPTEDLAGRTRAQVPGAAQLVGEGRSVPS